MLLNGVFVIVLLKRYILRKQKNMDSHHNTSKIQTNPLVTKCRTTDQLYHSEFGEYLSFSEYIS